MPIHGRRYAFEGDLKDLTVELRYYDRDIALKEAVGGDGGPKILLFCPLDDPIIAIFADVKGTLQLQLVFAEIVSNDHLCEGEGSVACHVFLASQARQIH